MTAPSARGWMLGLGMGLGCALGTYFAVSHGQQAQAERLERVTEELTALRKAIQARPPMANPPAAAPGLAAGIPPSMGAAKEPRLSVEDLDALARRMVILLQQEGGLASSERSAEPPAPPPALNQQQQQSLVRASGMVDRVLSVGRMTNEDVAQIRRELSSLSSRAEADEIRRKLIVAINQNKLVPPEGPEPLP